VGGGLDPYRGRPVPLCGTYDKVTAKLYVDGILKNSAALTGSFPNDTDQFAIGSRGGGNQAGQQLSGAYISIVLIFKRTLSDAEVASLSANPWQLFASAPLGMFDEAAAGGGSVTGTLASTEASDTLAATGSVLVTGTLASNEGADSLAAAGSVLVSGTLAAAEAADTLTASGTVANGVVGTMAITEGGDTLAGTGSVLVSGTLAQTEGADTLAADGAVIGSPISGTLAVTEEPDTLAATDAPPVTGGGDGGGAGGYGEVRRFADLLDKHKKLTRAQKKQRRKELVEEALELLPDLPQAEAIAPVLARLAYEQEAQVRARVVAQPALAPVVAPFDADAYLRELVVQWTADEDMRRTLEAEADEEYEIELLLMGA
jgi:hypothetical protein